MKLKELPFSVSLSRMQEWVFFSCNNFKIVGRIIPRVIIFMMNQFSWFKVSSNSLFHNQSMFHYIPRIISEWMFWATQLNVSIAISFTAIPIIIVSSFKRSIVAFSRTVVFVVSRSLSFFSYDFFPADTTFFNNHRSHGIYGNSRLEISQ